MPDPVHDDDQIQRLDRLGDAMDAFLRWSATGPADRQDTEAFLLAHAPLRDLLEPMLADRDAGTSHGPTRRPTTIDDADPTPGQHFDDYRIVREVGRGGMGTVYEAEQVSLRRRVALKVLHAHLTWSPGSIERFRREASAAASLRHPAIVPIHEVGEWRGRHFFTMEFVAGRTLHELMDQPRLGVRHDCSRVAEAAELVARVADALQHAHDRGLVHRDVKPHNILVGADGAVHLLDFGVARHHDGLESQTGEFAGTPHYCSPEHARGEPALPTSDVFSLGIVLYELLAGRRPFAGSSARQVLRCIELGDCEPLARVAHGVPRDLQVICAKAMERQARDRYPSAGEMAADLRRFLRIEPIRARAPGLLTRAGKWVRRHPLRVAVWALLLLLIAGVPSGYALHEHRTRRLVERERQRLDEAERLAFDGLERSVALLSEQLDRQPGLGARKLANADAVVRMCEAFVSARAAEPNRQLRAAHVLHDLADVQRRLGRPEQGLELCQQALAILDRATAATPADAASNALRGRLLRRQLTLRQHVDPARGAEEFERAIACWQDLIDAPGTGIDVVLEYADTLLVRARALAALPRRRLEAERLLLRAQTLLVPERRRSSQAAELLALQIDTALGHVLLWTGRASEALQTLQPAQQRLAARPNDLSWSHDNALALAAIGEAQQRLGQGAAAEAALRAAIAAAETVETEFPGVATLQRALLTSRVRLATLLLGQRKVADAEALLRAAAAAVGPLSPPPGPGTWMDRALLADLQVQTANCILLRCAPGGDCEEARQLLHAACALLEELVHEQPEQLELQVDLGGAWHNLAAMANDKGDPIAGRQFAERAIACQQQVLRLAPETRRAQLFLGMHHGQLALACARGGSTADAIAAASAATRLTARHTPTLRLAAEAATEAAAMVAGDVSLDDATRARLVADHGKVAVDALARLANVDRSEAARLIADQRFAFLRDRADFTALRTEVQRR